jgi:ABC-2 type transport system ATP-binding protein
MLTGHLTMTLIKHMTNSCVDSRQLVVERRRTEVLHGLDFVVETGSVTGLLGPSGCGKTTLMRAIVGTQAIRSGRLRVLGLDAGDARLRGAIGYASQSASIYPDLTVVENVQYFAEILGARTDVDRVIALVDLTSHADRLAGRLSGGQLSRVNLAVALLGNPRFLVLDEPTVGLDPVLREDLWRIFADLADSGTTLLVSSHVMDEAQRCDQVMVMRAGRLLAHEPPAALQRRTATTDLDAAFLELINATGAVG